MSETVIGDTSALIALEKINSLEILCKIYAKIILPEAVIEEFGTPVISCYSVRKVTSELVRLLMIDLNLGKGEAEVIALAKETGMKIIIDDQKARKVAKRLGLHVTGAIGILIKAESLGLIKSAFKKTKELREKGFYVSEELLDDISKFSKHQ